MFTGITLKQISSLSGYSVSTVSKALNDKYEIGESTKKKIRRIAKLNNYVPNSAAQALRNRKTKMIAVIVPNITSNYFNNFICEVQKEAFAIGYRVLILQSFDNIKKEKQCVRSVNDGSVDGILMLSNSEHSNTGFELDIPRNCITLSYEDHEKFCKKTMKEVANSSFQKLIS
tara:strand:- start:25805 stop:26323 length:519 start_codon:yes stop_codon:yes gene_type:complete